METDDQRDSVNVDWGKLTQKELTQQSFRLFACRLVWQRYGDKHAQQALLRASQSTSLELRSLATRLLASDRVRVNEI
jgi:hypothetical protein